MKKLILTLTIIPALFLSSCATTSGWFTSHEAALKQAFGDAIRSIEGAGLGQAQVVSAIRAARVKWLPPESVYSKFVEDLIVSFLAGNPTLNTTINSTLESVATLIQTTRP
jgi:hypothetical protein